MKKLNFLMLPALIGSALTIGSCGGEEVATGPKYNFERADTLPSGYLEELGIVKTNIEVTAHLYENMNSSGMTFNEGVLLPAGKSYSGSSKQAMGIGATGSDLVFSASFGQNQSAMNRLKGLVDLANALGVGEAFDEEMMTKMASDDTTINKSVLLTKAYLKAKDQLFSDERAQYATFMIIGGWIEGLHIGSQMLSTEIKNEDIRLGYWEMCNSWESIMHLCDVFKNNQEMTTLKTQLEGLGPVLNPIRKNSKKFTVAEVSAIAQEVSKLRGSVL